MQRVKFQLNKRLDKEVCKNFLQIKVAGLDFRAGIFKIHPKLKNISKKIEIDRYIEDYYNKHHKELIQQRNKFDKIWREKEEEFLKNVNKIFKGHNWPKGKYICYLSIFFCGPRFLEDKTFQSFYKYPQNVLIGQVAHEMLHFIFYDYALKKYPKIFKKLDTEKGIFWDLAEIFNSVILAEPEFKKIHKQKRDWSYPAHREYLKRAKKYWQEFKDIDIWIKKTFDYLKKCSNSVKK